VTFNTRTTIKAATLAFVINTSAAMAQDQKFELKFSSWVPPSHGMHPAVNQWLESIGKASGGSITGKLFPAQQLGKAPDHYDMARDGIAEVTFISVGIQPGRLPIAEGGNLFFLHNDGDAGSRAYDAWYRKYAALEMKDVKFCFGFVHDPGTFFSKKAIRVPADLKGVKVRSSTAQTSDLLTDIGAVNVNLAAPEMRSGLESGVVDAIMGPWKSNILFGIDKVVTHATDMNLYSTSFAVLLNKAVYDKMNAKQKSVMDDHCSNRWAGVVGKTWGDYEAAGRKELAAKAGFNVNKLTDAEVAQWRQAAQGARKRWLEAAKKAGVDGDKAYAELEAEAKKAQGR
jgi:TRAP-type C4-dicarboxylate transport system substrate-binding protein